MKVNLLLGAGLSVLAALAAPEGPGKKEQDRIADWIVQLSSGNKTERDTALGQIKKLDRSETGRLIEAKRARPALEPLIDEAIEAIWEMPADAVEPTLKAIAEWDPGSEAGTEEIWKRLAALRGKAVPFLEYLRKEEGEKGAFAREQAEAFKTVRKGERLFFGKAKCSSCHAIGREGAGAKGPNLEGIGKVAEDLAHQRFVVIGRRMSAADYLVESLIDPDAWVGEGYEKGTHPNLREDPVSLQDSEIQALVVFLQALGGKPKPGEVHIPEKEE